MYDFEAPLPTPSSQINADLLVASLNGAQKAQIILFILKAFM